MFHIPLIRVDINTEQHIVGFSSWFISLFTSKKSVTFVFASTVISSPFFLNLPHTCSFFKNLLGIFIKTPTRHLNRGLLSWYFFCNCNKKKKAYHQFISFKAAHSIVTSKVFFFHSVWLSTMHKALFRMNNDILFFLLIILFCGRCCHKILAFKKVFSNTWVDQKSSMAMSNVTELQLCFY